jgi:hypothetical protein
MFDVAGVVVLPAKVLTVAGTCLASVLEDRTPLIVLARSGESNPGTNLHVSGLNPRVTDRILEDTFSQYGKVRSPG